MRRTRSWILLVPLSGVMLFGFGCKKNTPAPPQNIAPVTATSSAPTPPTKPTSAKPQTTPPPDGYIDTRVVRLREALGNLAKANSFRASIRIKAEDGLSTGEVEFVRGTGFHGTLRTPDGQTSEVYLLNNNLFIRANTTTWTNVTGAPEAEEMKELFQAAFTLDENGATAAISETARIQRISDDPTGCELHEFTQYTPEGNKIRMQMCLKDLLPTRLVSEIPSGAFEIKYRDINAPIELTVPIK